MTPQTPPSDLHAEDALLAAMLAPGDSIEQALDHVRAADFYRPANGTIFTAIVKLWAAGEPVDMLTVADSMSASQLEQAGGKQRIIELGFDTAMRSLTGSYARIVANKARLRRLIGLCRDGIELAYSDPEDLAMSLDTFEAQVFDMVHDDSRKQADLASIGEELLDHIEVLEERARRYQAGEHVAGLPTGLTDLDDLLGGMIDGGLYVVGAEPGAGKSSLALDIACHNAAAGVPVVGFNQEMTRPQVVDRFIASQRGVGITGEDLKQGRLGPQDFDNIRRLQANTADWPLHVVKKAAVTPMEIRAAARKLRSKHKGLGLIFVDYLQLMRLGEKAENRQNEVARLSGELKAIAMDFELPVIALAQLNREATKNHEIRPRMTDLKDSGAIEADAEAVMLIYREEKHNPATTNKGVAEIIVDKNRNGGTGKVEVSYSGKFTTFGNLDRRHAEDGLTPAQRLASVSGGRPTAGDDGAPQYEDWTERADR